MKTSEIINLGIGLEIHFCLDAADTNAQFTMFKVVIHPNAKVPAAHYHENFDETIYGLKGSLTLIVDDQIITLGPGDYQFINRGSVHNLINQTDEIVEILAFANPGIFTANYFKDLLGVLKVGGPPDKAKLNSIMLQYGLIPVSS
ncbi:cupin domain-containing protein [Dyadobacter koreensis]|nr:cupin domain-containing protein [Dyadobacter koreensis]